jgi:hypothetical protein
MPLFSILVGVLGTQQVLCEKQGESNDGFPAIKTSTDGQKQGLFTVGDCVRDDGLDDKGPGAFERRWCGTLSLRGSIRVRFDDPAIFRPLFACRGPC